MANTINININNSITLSCPTGISISDVVKEYKRITGKCVLGAKLDNIIVDMNTELDTDKTLYFLDYNDSEGNKIYQAGLKFLLILAAKHLWKKDIIFKYSLDKGIYAEIDKELDDDSIKELKEKMLEIVSYDYPMKNCITTREDAIRYYLSTGEIEKADNIHNTPNQYVILNNIKQIYNYFYGYIPESTGELKIFEIQRINKNGIILTYPRVNTGNNIPKFNFNKCIYDELKRHDDWSKRIQVTYVNELNKKVANGEIQKFIKLNNIFINDSLATVAKDVVKKNEDVKIILIGGPSSSGKTTSAYRLCTFLETFGLKPIVISADDYFKEREETPKDPDGNYDFESLKAIDLELFNAQLKKLLNGEEVIIPKFNFVTGKKEYIRKPIHLNDDNVLLIEGIHCLNETMTKSINRKNKYKIYVCPFTPLGLDRHNHLSTTDMRLIRRIVRDNRVRGRNVETTLESWKSVKDGEEKYIFPYIDDADAVINTAHTYEMGVLRVYAEPLLYSIPFHSPYYDEARRLLGLLRMFYPISSEYIENDNTLREFIGGSIYEK